MDTLDKIDKILKDEDGGSTTSSDIAQNTTKGNVDVIGGECPKGQRYCSRRKKCVPNDIAEELDIFLQETTYSGDGYGTGADIAGSGQTRVHGSYSRFGKDTEITNINKKDGVRWNKILGMYVPREKGEE